jgi:hypothetical protein
MRANHTDDSRGFYQSQNSLCFAFQQKKGVSKVFWTKYTLSAAYKLNPYYNILNTIRPGAKNGWVN